MTAGPEDTEAICILCGASVSVRENCEWTQGESVCDSCLEDDRNRWQAKYEKAEASCAALREALEILGDHARKCRFLELAHGDHKGWNGPPDAADCDCGLNDALATDAGKGWVSPAEHERVQAACAAMRGPLQAIADNCRVLADDCHWHHGGAGCNGECIWSGVKRALATDAGTALLARLRDAEEKATTERIRRINTEAERDTAFSNDAIVNNALEQRDAARAERDSTVKATEARIAAAERLATVASPLRLQCNVEPACGGCSWCRFDAALAAYEQTRAVRP